MTAPATIDLKANRDRAGFNKFEYDLTYRGIEYPNVQIIRTLDPVNKSATVYIGALKVNGKPALNNSQMDAVARKFFNKPRAYAGVSGAQRMARWYIEA